MTTKTEIIARLTSLLEEEKTEKRQIYNRLKDLERSFHDCQSRLDQCIRNNERLTSRSREYASQIKGLSEALDSLRPNCGGTA